MSTQYVTNALSVLRTKIDPEHPAFEGSDEVRAALMSIRGYIEAWAPPIITVAEGRFPEMRPHINRDAAHVRKAMREGLFPPKQALSVDPQ